MALVACPDCGHQIYSLQPLRSTTPLRDAGQSENTELSDNEGRVSQEGRVSVQVTQNVSGCGSGCGKGFVDHSRAVRVMANGGRVRFKATALGPSARVTSRLLWVSRRMKRLGPLWALRSTYCSSEHVSGYSG
jgi:hypothetical protein